MVPKVIQLWHKAVESRDLKILDTLLAEEATMFSPVVHTPAWQSHHQALFDGGYAYYR
jgi:ketosteroid isomerase-like protein